MADEKRVSHSGASKPDSSQTGRTGGTHAATGRKNVLSESLRNFEDAHLNYLRELQDTWADAQQRYQKACQQNAQAFSSFTAPEDPLKRYESYRNQVEQLQQSFSPEDVRKRFEEAYRNHLRAIKDAWARLDVDAIDFGSGF
jgi:hypothetical protein